MQGHELLVQGQGPEVHDQEVITNTVSSVAQNHEVSQGQGPVSQGHEKVIGVGEPTIGELRRERARQRRLARYS